MRRWRAKDPTRHAAYMRDYRAKDPEAYRAYMRSYHRKQRERVIAHYGAKCACCGETTWEFLSIDHMNGGGTQHKKEIGAGRLVEWVIRNNFPTEIQILCHNCNQAKGFYGVCPHQRVE